MTTADTGPPTTPAELSLLIFQQRPRNFGPCRVCGADTLKIIGIGGATTLYVCETALLAAAQSEVDRDTQQAWTEHYQRSKQATTYPGDAQITRALLELRALRTAAGDNMTVPAGTLVFPHGHGENRCYRYQEHTGDDQWIEHVDFTYQHNPAHAHQAHAEPER